MMSDNRRHPNPQTGPDPSGEPAAPIESPAAGGPTALGKATKGQMSPRPSSPADLGYRMPAEWEPHEATWLTWPRPEGISFAERYDEILPVFAQLIDRLRYSEEVHLNVWDQKMELEVRRVLKRHRVPEEAVTFHPFPAYEPWCRDHGPIFLVHDRDRERERAVVNWQFNAWGGKYPPYDLDDAIPRAVAHYRSLPLFEPGIVLEGGSIEVNGQGTLLTTESCLLHPNRNPGLSREQIESYLRAYLGVRHILWLERGIEGDDTDGHVDDLTRFVDADTVVTVLEDDPADPNYAPLLANYRRLQEMTDESGRPLRIVTLPTPGRIEYQKERLPASYANFYIANRTVLVPVFGHPNDAKALETLQSLFPRRRVVGMESTALVWGLGSFHCLTQQEPAKFYPWFDVG